MKYYYYNPFSRQYYFPEGFDNYPVFSTFYKAYKFNARLFWKMWRNSSFVRNLFYTNHAENILPINQISKYVSAGSVVAYNLGTKGIEQKITALSIDTITHETFFIKYATSTIAIANVLNEAAVLKQLSALSFVPELILSAHEDQLFTLIKTTVLAGDKMEHHLLNKQLLDILFTLSKQHVKSHRNYKSDLLNCFAHGDFCPWNMVVNDGEIKLFDWELAGQYPLGYDLFTYIFQYQFLVKEIKRFDKVLKENEFIIQQYFDYFEIDDWTPYLQEFAKLKYEIALKKNNAELIDTYRNMKQELKTNDYLEKSTVEISSVPLFRDEAVEISQRNNLVS